MSDGNSGFNAVFGGGGGVSSPTLTYGSFISQLDQTIVAPLSPTQIALPTTFMSNGISVQTDGTIDFTANGVYMLEATINFFHSAPLTADTGYVWYQIGGFNIPDSTRLIRLNQNIFTNTLSVSYMFSLDYLTENIKLFFTASSTDISIQYANGGTNPNISSVICNVFQIA